MKAKTKDERFVLALHTMASKLGDPFLECNKYRVGEAIGLKPKAIDTICNLLAQCNFIKKRGPELVLLTQHGLGLVTTLQGQK